jgi:small subunit ribosomal protein S8
MTDPIADLLARIKNGLSRGFQSIDAPHSKQKLEILRILKEEGFIVDAEKIVEDKFPAIRVTLKYDARRGRPVISHLKRVSTSGRRDYRGAGDLKPVRGGLATLIITTSQGVMTDREARRRNIGGEVLCEVW